MASRERSSREPAPQKTAEDPTLTRNVTDARAAVAERPDTIERVDKTERPDTTERVDRTEGVERTERPEKTERAERVERTERPEKTERAERPDTTARVDDRASLDDATTAARTTFTSTPDAPTTSPVASMDPAALDARPLATAVPRPGLQSNLAESGGNTDVSLSLEDLASVNLGGAMYADPVAAYNQMEANVEQQTDAVADARQQYYEALSEIEDVAHRYETAMRSGDQTAEILARMDLAALKNDAEAFRGELEQAQSALDAANEAIDTFAQQYPQVVEDATGLTAEQRSDLAEHNDLQDAVTQATAELAALNNSGFAQAVSEEKTHWEGEQTISSAQIEVADYELTVANATFTADLVHAFGAATVALANPATYEGSNLSPGEMATFQELVADPTSNPIEAFAFLNVAGILPPDHPAMVKLEQSHETKQEKAEDKQAAIERHEIATEALAGLDFAVETHQGARDELEDQLREAERQLGDFERDNPQLGDWIDTDLEQAQQALDAAEREVAALEEARIAHLERALEKLEEVGAGAEHGSIHAQSGALAFVQGSAAATSSFDESLQEATAEVGDAEAALAAIDTDDASGADSSSSPTLDIGEAALVSTPLAFGSGAQASRGVDDDTDEASIDEIEFDAAALTPLQTSVATTQLQPESEPLPLLQVQITALDVDPVLDEPSRDGDRGEDETSRSADSDATFDSRDLDFDFDN